MGLVGLMTWCIDSIYSWRFSNGLHKKAANFPTFHLIENELIHSTTRG